MQAWRQLGGGVLIALISVALVIGGITLALVEGNVPAPRPSTETAAPIPQAFPTFTSSPVAAPETPTYTLTPLPSDTPLPPTDCPPPAGWIAVMVASGDTLNSLAQQYNTSTGNLMAANCLVSPDLPAGYTIFVPPLSFPTVSVRLPTAPVCGHPLGWVLYSVQRGDTLFHLSTVYRLTVADIQRANCLSSQNLVAGQRLWVPYIPPTKIVTPTVISTLLFASATDTNTPIVPTRTEAPTATQPLPTDTLAPTAPPTEPVIEPTLTITPFPTKTP